MTAETARRLRGDATEAEAKLWSRLRDRQIEGAKFRRQMPIAGHIADFACTAARLIIEVDGGQNDPVSDVPRTAVIEAAGYLVIRFWNHNVLGNIEGVLETIVAELRNARPAG